MPKRDVLDEEIARQFAWRISVPETKPAEEPKPEAPAPAEVDPIDAKERAQYAAERCAELAEEVRKAWSLSSMPHQAAATKRLLRLAGRMSFDIVRMDDYPLESLRLWRLVVRHHQPGRSRRTELFNLSFMPISTRQAEVTDLLVEAAVVGDNHIAFLLDQSIATEDTGRRHPELGERLAALVDNAKTWPSRALAARWLSLDEFPAAIPALRRALRKPHIRLRYYALFILLQMKDALLEEDVLFLLEDAVKHPLPRGFGESGEKNDDYESALLDAVKQIKPKDGWRPLEVIASGGGEHIFRERPGLDDGWGMKALAAGYPERATKRIDRALLAPSLARSYDAIEAIARLPDDLARPRLIDAAGHGENHVCERAKAIWFERFGGVCPVDPLVYVPKELLTEPPSERFWACLTVLRGASNEARFGIVDALLAEAPEVETPPLELSTVQREALALLLFALRFRSGLYRHPTLGKLSERDWVKLLMQRFGSLAFDGFCSIAEPPALAGISHGWFDVLADGARQGTLSKSQVDTLRAISQRVLASPTWDNVMAPLVMLSVVKPDLSDEPRLWEILTAPFHGKNGKADESDDDDHSPIRSPKDASRWAVYALQDMQGSPTLDQRLTRATEEAVARGQWEFFNLLVGLSAKRNVAAVFDIAKAAVLAYDGNLDTEKAMLYAANYLKPAGWLDEAWVVSVLEQPESPLFPIATHLVDRNAPASLVDILWRQIDSTARGGATAAEATLTLVWLDVMKGNDPRIDGILSRAPMHQKASLCTTLVDWKVPIDPYRRYLVECLLSPSDVVTGNLIESLYCREPEGTSELFEELLPKATNKRVKSTMRHYLKAPNEAARYWVDGGDDEDDEDDDDFDDEDDDEDDEDLDG